MIYILIISVLIGNINLHLGVSIGMGIKVNLTDILFMIYLFYDIIICRRKYVIYKPIKYIFFMLIIMTISLYIGMLNGSSISEGIRILRNIIYILLMFLISCNHYKYKKQSKIYDDLIIFSWIAIINCIINVLGSFIRTNWFIYYRENASFQVFMFIYLLFYKSEYEEGVRKKIIRSITILFLVICIFLSQERLQIMAVAVALLVAVIYKALNIIKSKKIKIFIKPKRIIVNFIILILIITVIIKILKIEYIQNYINYFFEYRIRSVITGSGFKVDGSLSDRSLQVINIFNRDWIYYVFGSGLASLYLSATGLTYIVDGMWLWIFKDLGIIGLAILFTIYISIAKEVRKVINNKISIVFGLISILILQIFTPNLMLGICDSVFMGYILMIIYIGRSDYDSKKKL